MHHYDCRKNDLRTSCGGYTRSVNMIFFLIYILTLQRSTLQYLLLTAFDCLPGSDQSDRRAPNHISE